ncbi:carbohydrate-binding protein [Streptomyces sp. NBC_01450]|uniref:carbohydrate-binding protein n=1 Tax=Streptomyces sp. NBC_01450 TaxID=2903871 RepID=UPI002E37E83B|nr:carbohydrate-binding protein [Streptomyces sp. NBC_01450]
MRRNGERQPLAAGASEGPYGGTSAAVPGRVQAENYDTGGQGVAYSVTSVNGSANFYRVDGVDPDNTADTGGGYDLGWTSGGQWFRYAVDVAAAGIYTLGLRVAAPSAVAGALHLSDASGVDLPGAVDPPATSDWQTWATVTTHVSLPAGRQILTLNQDSGGWNINYLGFAAGSGSPSATLTVSPGSLTFADQAVNTTSAAQTVSVGAPPASPSPPTTAARGPGVRIPDLEPLTPPSSLKTSH